MGKTNKENRKRKSPWRFAFLTLAIVGFWELAGGYLMMWVLGLAATFPTKASSIGVIGGADGPTAVFVTSSVQSWIHYVPAVVLIMVGIVGFMKLRNLKTKKEF